MPFLNHLKTYFITLITFLIIDFTWLGLIAKNFYSNQLKPFNVVLKLPAALLTYLILTLGLVIFVFPQAKNLSQAAIYGALFGLVTYSLYDFTNLATLPDWPLTMTLVDILWGSLLCSLVSMIVTLVNVR